MRKIAVIFLLAVLGFPGRCATAVTVTRTVFLNNFAAGELDPKAMARVDFPEYRKGAKTLENMIVSPLGPISRRPGTKYIATVKDAADETRVISFPYSNAFNYIVELGDEYARFYRVGLQITGTYSAWANPTDYVIGDLVTEAGSYYRCLVSHTSGTFTTDQGDGYWETTDGVADLAYEIVTPWDESDVFGLQMAMMGGTMRLVHGDYEPYKLTRTDHAAWTCTAIDSTTGPFLSENLDRDWTLTPGGTTDSISLESSKDLFDKTRHEGALFQITHIVAATSVTGIFNPLDGSTLNSISLTVQRYRTISVTTSGYWTGDFLLQRSYDGEDGNWLNVFAPRTQQGDGNVQYMFQEMDGDAIYRVRIENFVVSFEGTPALIFSEIGSLTYNLSANLFANNGVVEITTVTDSKNAIATVKYTLASATATYQWSEGAWSDYRGHPRTIEVHEQRAIYGGTAANPETIWASIIADKAADYDDFTLHIFSDWSGNLGGPDDIAWQFNCVGAGDIQWIKSREFLMIGTTKGVGKLGQPGKPINQNFYPIFRMQPSVGAAYIQPVTAEDSVLYVERGGRKVRELTYAFTTERYVAPDLTILAWHITRGGIVDIAFQNRPDPVLWSVRADGQLLSLTYQRKYGVIAWSRNITGASGKFKSVANITGGNKDELWSVVARTLNSGAVKYIEQHQDFDWGTDQNDCWFVDSGTDDITDLIHLEGETVALWADGRTIGTYTVASGIISPSGSYTNTTVGLPYTSVFETMPLVARDRSGNIVNAYETNIHRVLIDFSETLGCHFGLDATNSEDLDFGVSSTKTIDVVTGFRYPAVFQGTERAPTLYFFESDPVPLTIRSVNAETEIEF